MTGRGVGEGQGRDCGSVVRHIRAVFDRAAAGYDREPLRIFAFAADRLIGHAGIKPGHKVLDVATGTGVVAVSAAQVVGPAGRVTAIDVSERMLDRTQEKLARLGVTNVDVHLMDAGALEFRAGYFDAVVCSHALELLPDMEDAVQGWVRVLRPGGVLAFSSFGAGAFEPMLGMLMRRIARRMTSGAGPVFAIGPHRLAVPQRCQQLLQGAGLDDRRVVEEALGYHLRDASEWWEVIMGSGLRELPDQLDPAAVEAVRDEHLAELAAIMNENGLWLDGRTLFAVARRT